MRRTIKPSGPLLQLKIRLPQSLHERLVASATVEGISLTSEVVRQIEAGFQSADMNAAVERAVERALSRDVKSAPEPIGSPPPAYRQ